MGVSHGGRGVSPSAPEFEVGDGNANCPPDFVMFQNYKHNAVTSLPTHDSEVLAEYSLFTKIHLQRPPNYHFMRKIQHCSGMDQSTAQNASKHAISSQKFIFFWGGCLASPRPLGRVSPPHLNPSHSR